MPPGFAIDRARLRAPFAPGLSNAAACRIIWQEEESLQEDAAGDVTGNDQRRALQDVGREHILARFGDRAIEITDIRAGACITTFSHLLRDARQDIRVNLIEASAARRAEYAAQAEARPHVTLGRVHKGPVTDFTRPPPSLWRLLLRLPRFVARESQDCVLMLHTLHALRPGEIAPALRYAYRLLRPGGVLAVVYARQDLSAMGQVALDYFAARDPLRHAAVSALYALKKKLLAEGGIVAELDAACPGFRAALTSFTQETRSFRPSPEKLAWAMMMNDLLPADEAPFDPALLDFAAGYLEAHPDKTGVLQLPANDPARGGWYSALQQQQVAIIEKRAAFP